MSVQNVVGTYTLHLEACHTCCNYSLDFEDCSLPPFFTQRDLFSLSPDSLEEIVCDLYSPKENSPND